MERQHNVDCIFGPFIYSSQTDRKEDDRNEGKERFVNNVNKIKKSFSVTQPTFDFQKFKNNIHKNITE